MLQGKEIIEGTMNSYMPKNWITQMNIYIPKRYKLSRLTKLTKEVLLYFENYKIWLDKLKKM